MKKIFTLIAVALVAMGVNAENLWTGSEVFDNWSGSVKIEASAFEAVKNGAVLSVTYSKNDGASEYKLAFKDAATEGWPLLAGTGYDATGSPQSITLLGVNYSTVKNGGLVLQGSGITVTSVDYANPEIEPSENAIWLGKTVFDSWNATVAVGAGFFAKASVGDIIRVIYTDKTSAFNPIFKKYADWSDFSDLQSVKKDGDGYFEAEINANALTELQANGLRFQGVGFTMTEIQLIPSTPSDPNLLWEGENSGEWNNQSLVSTAKIQNSGLKAGDMIKVTFSTFVSDNQVQVYIDWGVNLVGTHQGYLYDGHTDYIFGVTTENLAAMQGKGFFVTGKGMTITKIERIEGTGHEDALWFGQAEMTETCSNLPIVGRAATENDKYMLITIEGTPDYLLIANSGWTDLTLTPTISDNVYQFEVTDDLKATLSSFIVKAKNCTIKEIKFTSATAINTAKAAAQQDGARYNLAGQKVSDSYKGIVIMNGKKVVMK